MFKKKKINVKISIRCYRLFIIKTFIEQMFEFQFLRGTKSMFIFLNNKKAHFFGE